MVELAIAKIVGGTVLMPPKEWMVRPSEPITWQAERVHGISNRDVRGKQTLSEVSGDLELELGAEMIIGHHVGVDYRVLQLSLPKWKPSATLDTLKLARTVVPGLESYSLSALVEEFNLENVLEGRPHRAAYDALAAAHVFVILAKRFDGNGDLTLDAILDICGSNNAEHRAENRQGSLF
ncbi:3'-5' exonuclease [Sulfuricella denitrificans]|uniref:3'-5' exonuclease n=1 Tax=Sulfuricella denitrificans TaxID=649841 RepID=UPI000685A281